MLLGQKIVFSSLSAVVSLLKLRVYASLLRDLAISEGICFALKKALISLMVAPILQSYLAESISLRRSIPAQ